MWACECQNLAFKKRYKQHEVHCAYCGGSLTGESAAAQPTCGAWEQQTHGSTASAGSRMASFHLTVWFCLWPWTLTIPISVGGLQHALFLVSHLLLVYRHLQKPSPGWRDWKAAAIKIGDIYICMQFDLLTWSSVRFLGWSFPYVSASGTWADVTRLWLL